MVSLTGIRREKARRKLSAFFKYSWDVLEENTPLEWNWSIDAICDHLEAAYLDWIAVRKAGKIRGAVRPPQRIQNLIMNVPPGTGKSRIVMVAGPAWMWLQEPSWKVICASGNPRVATRDSLYCRTIVDSDWYRGWFDPQWQLSGDQNAKTLFENTAGGSRMAIGVGAKIVGVRGDAIQVDDPNDPDSEDDSSAQREAANTWWDMGAGNRVNDMRSSLRILIMQRLHEDDLSGHVKLTYPWTELVLPMEYDPQLVAEGAPSPIGFKDPRTVAGEVMFPTRFPPEVLASEKKRLGSYGYAGQYGQKPSPAGGSIFKKEWFGFYKSVPKLKEVWTAWDTALKAAEQNDESSHTTAGLGEDGDLYILKMWHGREETPELGRRLIALATQLKNLYGDRYRGDFVEDKVSGTTLMQYLRRTNSVLAVIPVKVSEDKEARARGISPVCEAGRIWLPDPAIYPATQVWVRDLLDALALFPKGTRDDVVDAFVHCVRRFVKQQKDEEKAKNEKAKRERRAHVGGYA